MEPEPTQALVPDPDSAALSLVVEVEALRERGPEILGPSPYVLEIGFGRGELLIATAKERPDRTYVGLEVSRKRVLKMARRLARHELTERVRLLHSPAEYVLERVLPAAALAECWIHCPDPWPKKRHAHRRLLQPPTARWLARVLAPGGRLLISTDHPPYAEQIDGVLTGEPELINLNRAGGWSREAPDRPRTAYEQEWIDDGREIAYFSYARRGEPA